MRKSFILISIALFLFAAHFNAAAQYIYTVAGNGGIDYTGDHGQARAAQIHWPKGVAFDSASNLYIADYLNNVVRKVNPYGVITTIAGNGFEAGKEEGNYAGDGGPATAAHLWGPSGVCVDTNGFVYIADFSNNVVRVVDTTGIISTYAGTGVGGYSGDGGAATAAQLSGPIKVTLDTSGNLYIVDQGNNCIRAVTPAGVIFTIAGSPTLPYGYTGDGGPSTDAQMDMPADVSVDRAGDLYIADEGNEVIRYVSSSTGNISTIAGCGAAGYRGDGGPASTAQFLDPTGVALDTFGHLYISDMGNNHVRVLDIASDSMENVAGDGTEGYAGDDGPATNAELWTPQGLAVDRKGGLYIADQGNNRIRFLSTPLTAVSKVNNPATGVNVYPNPFEGAFTLYMPAGTTGSATITIANALGETVKKFETTGYAPIQVNFNGPPGIYFLKATTAQGTWGKVLNER